MPVERLCLHFCACGPAPLTASVDLSHPMQTSPPKRQLIMDGNRTLLPFCLGLLFLSAVLAASVILRWPRPLRAIGVAGLLLSPAFLLLTCWEILRYQRRWRTILAAFVSLTATAISWSTTILYATGGFH